jgi:predicted nucleic acid-binding protein
LARRHGLRLYSADTMTWSHRDRALAAGVPAAARWEALRPANRWDEESDASLLAMSLHRERGAMVLDDLRALPEGPLIVAEGTTLPAWAAEPVRAAWLPAPRGAGRTRLDRILDATIAAEAREHGLAVVTRDTVEARLAAAIADGPRATSRAERTALLREANEAVRAQVRGFHSRPWASGDAETVVVELMCECGDPACTATLARAVGAPGPVLAD